MTNITLQQAWAQLHKAICEKANVGADIATFAKSCALAAAQARDAELDRFYEQTGGDRDLWHPKKGQDPFLLWALGSGPFPQRGQYYWQSQDCSYAELACINAQKAQKKRYSNVHQVLDAARHAAQAGVPIEELTALLA